MRAEQENKEMRLKMQQLQQEVLRVQETEQRRVESKQRDWENTIGDLTRELKYTQGELIEKEGIFSRVEQELR